jgi:NADH-quinone oxidoreductase subunit K
MHPVPDGGHDPAGGHDRRDRADPSRHRATRGHARTLPKQIARKPSEATELTRSPKWARAWNCRRRAMIGMEHYIVVSSILFVLGVLGIFLNRKNVIVILMAIELILLAVNINLVAFSAFLGDLTGQIFAMFVLTVAAAEAAIGLAILVIYFRSRGTIAVDDINRMKGRLK